MPVPPLGGALTCQCHPLEETRTRATCRGSSLTCFDQQPPPFTPYPSPPLSARRDRRVKHPGSARRDQPGAGRPMTVYGPRLSRIGGESSTGRCHKPEATAA